uniref:Prohibitin n=1 Tax=Ananas comosus var. bracteatus TaxID=296719 RepID=A0A6V7NGQ7_ANACO|nr:unnamed protein product [Ananas comosus var. bracteatus]
MNFRNVRAPNVRDRGCGDAAQGGALRRLRRVRRPQQPLQRRGRPPRHRLQPHPGHQDKVYPEGTHLMIPWFERPIIYDVRARPHLVESTSGSRDLQMVFTSVLTRPLPERLPTIYRTLGQNYNERVLPSIIHETLKAVVAQYNASQLITQREVIIFPFIYRNKAHNFNIALDDVSITSLSFGKEFTHAIEAKQVAAQDAERAKFIVEKAEQDKKKARQKAPSLSAKLSQTTGGVLALRQIEAAREISHTLSNSTNKVFWTPVSCCEPAEEDKCSKPIQAEVRAPFYPPVFSVPIP